MANKKSKKQQEASAGDIGEKFKATSASEWKKSSKRTGQEMVLPSGHTCIATRVDFQVFLKKGKVPNSLRGMVDRAMQGKDVSQEEVMDTIAGEEFVQKLMDGDEETVKKFDDMMDMVDAVVVDCMVEPRVYSAPQNEEDREDDRLYPDDIDDQDKMFVFNYAVGGTRDIESFREGQGRNVEHLLAQQGSGGSA